MMQRIRSSSCGIGLSAIRRRMWSSVRERKSTSGCMASTASRRGRSDRPPRHRAFGYPNHVGSVTSSLACSLSLTNDTTENQQITTIATTTVLRSFVGMVYSDSSSVPDTLSGNELIGLSKLCDWVQSGISMRRLERDVRLRVAEDPWSVFIFATYKKNIPLGKATIEHSTMWPLPLGGCTIYQWTESKGYSIYAGCWVSSLTVWNIRVNYTSGTETVSKDTS